MELNIQKHIVLIDDEDRSLICSYNWTIAEREHTNYAITTKSGNTFYMHRLIMGAGPGDPEVDHENRNGLDCRRFNLRFITKSGQLRNRKLKNKTGFTGVELMPSGRYIARIRIDDIKKSIGTFDTAEEAGAAYQAAYEKQLSRELL